MTRLQGAAFDERSRACTTREWTLAAVKAHVRRQRAALGESGVALPTLERPLSGVRSTMANEAIHDID